MASPYSRLRKVVQHARESAWSFRTHASRQELLIRLMRQNMRSPSPEKKLLVARLTKEINRFAPYLEGLKNVHEAIELNIPLKFKSNFIEKSYEDRDKKAGLDEWVASVRKKGYSLGHIAAFLEMKGKIGAALRYRKKQLGK